MFRNASTTAFIVSTQASTNYEKATSSFHHNHPCRLRRQCRHDHTLQLSEAAVSTTTTIESFFITQPYLSAFLTCSFKASAADWIAQTQPFRTLQQQKQQQQQQQQVSSMTATMAPAASATNNNYNSNAVDLSRNLAFLLYGGLYQGMAQQFMYSRVFPDMFGHGPLDMTALASQVAFDMAIVGPFLCLPTAYIVKSLFAPSSSTSSSETSDHDETTDNTTTSTLTLGLEKYMNDVTQQGLLLKYWGLWTPVNFVTFGVVPPHFRVAFVATVSFFWVFVLSSVAGSSSKS